MTTLLSITGGIIGRHVDSSHAICAASERCREHKTTERFRVVDDGPEGVEEIIEVDASGHYTTIERIR